MTTMLMMMIIIIIELYLTRVDIIYWSPSSLQYGPPILRLKTKQSAEKINK